MSALGLAELLLPSIYNLHKCFILSYYFWALLSLSAFIIPNRLLPDGCVASSYFFLPFLFLGVGTGRDFSKTADYYKELGGEGNRIAFYLRVSTRKQARDGRSIDAQREAMDILIKREKPSVVYGYWDPGKSGTKFEDRKVMEIIELSKAGMIDEFWVAYIDRIGRNLLDMIEFLCILWRNNVYIRTPEKVYKNDDLPDLIMIIIECFMSERTNVNRKERANNSKRKNFLDKLWNKTAVPVGYIKNEDGWLTIIEEWVPIIRDIYKYFINGASYASISRKINTKCNLTDIDSLSAARVRSILNDPVYIGKPEHYGAFVDDSLLRLIPDDLFNQTQERLEILKRKRRKRKEIDPLQSFVKKHDISYLDFLKKNVKYICDYCGGDLVRNGSRKIDEIDRQNFLCKKCGKQIWVPNQSQMKKIRESYEEKTRTVNPLKDFNPQKRDKKPSKKKERKTQNTNLDDFIQ